MKTRPAFPGGMLGDMLIRSGSDLFNVAVNLAIITLIARHLATGDYGTYTQLITTTSLLLPILLLRLNSAAVRFFPAHAGDKAAIRDRFMTITLVVLATLSLFVLLLAPFTAALESLIFADQASTGVMPYLAAFLGLRCLVTLFIDYFRSINRSSRSSYYNSLRFALALLAISIQVVRDGSLLDILRAQLLAELLTLSALMLHLWKLGVFRLRFRLSLAELAPYLRYALPLLPYTFFIAVNQFADRYFIAHFVGLDAAGIYTFTYNMVAAAFLLNTSIGYVIYPHLSRLWHDDNSGQLARYLELGIHCLLLFALPITCGLGFVYGPVTGLLVGEAFQVEGSLVLFIAAGYVAYGLGSLIGYLIDLSGRTMLFVRVLLVTASLNCLLNWVLIPRWGMQGAAVATFATYALQCLLVWWLASGATAIRVRLDAVFVGACLLAATIMYFALDLLPPITDLVDIIAAVALGAGTYFAVVLLLSGKKLVTMRNLL